MSRGLAAVAVVAALAFSSSDAKADEPEAIRFVASAPPGCVARQELVAQIAALGGELREPREGERARDLAVTIARGHGSVDVHLVVHDLVGRESERRVQSPDCAAAAKAASLLVVLALDEPHPERVAASAPSEDAPPPPSPVFWPPPVRADGGTTGMRVVRAGRLGSGGVLVTGTHGFNLRGGTLTSVRALAMARVVSTTRLGVGATLSRDARDFTRESLAYQTAGWSGRLGGTFGWGAPWDDSVVGFLGELGVAAGEQHGAAYSMWRVATATSDRFVSPFVSWSILFQVPRKAWPVRPVAGLTGCWTPFEAQRAVVGYGATLGVVWQAW